MSLKHFHHHGPFHPLWIGVMILLSAMLYFGSGQSQPKPKSNEALLREFQAAFNKHDTAAMLARVADSVQWCSIEGARLSIEVDGKAALETWLTGYFKSCPSCRSEIESMMTAGPYITVNERAMWEAKSGPKSQKSLAVYEMRGGLIQRVWYYPAETK